MSDKQQTNATTAEAAVLTSMKAKASAATEEMSSTKKQSTKKASSGNAKKPSSGADRDNSSTSNKSQTGKNKRASRSSEHVVFPVEPRVIQVVKKPRTFTNHSYRDFSSVPPEPGEEVPTEISEMTFPQKVHHILSQPQYSRFVCWQPHGRAFRITIPKLFESEVCPKYLGHTRYSSFLRQLSNHSFKHITKGEDRNCYYHEFMLRGLPHLCKYMPKPKDARRLIPDPDNEPDFYAISKAFPVPESPEVAKVQGTLESNASAQEDLPTAKRARVAVSDLKSSGQSSSAAAAPPSAEGLNPASMAMSPTLAPTLAASLLAATTSGSLPLTAPAQMANSMANPPANGNSNALGSNWAALRDPQMQAAADRNTILLQALRAGLVNQNTAPAAQAPQPPPVSTDLASSLVAALAGLAPQAPQAQPPSNSADQATTLAAALIQQMVNESEQGRSDPNSALASLAALVRGNLSS